MQDTCMFENMSFNTRRYFQDVLTGEGTSSDVHCGAYGREVDPDHILVYRLDNTL